MKFHFSRGFVSKTDKPLTYQESLMLDLQKTRCELEDAYAGFDYVTDPALIDCYIYEQNAVMKRYRYLLRQAAGLSSETLSLQDAVRRAADPIFPDTPPISGPSEKSPAGSVPSASAPAGISAAGVGCHTAAG